jgi:hypothetical protein
MVHLRAGRRQNDVPSVGLDSIRLSKGSSKTPNDAQHPSFLEPSRGCSVRGATGTAKESSDYDVLLILPDGTPDWMRARAMGDVWSLGQRHGVEINREQFTASSFDDPTEEDSVLVSEVLSFGFRVPPAQ